jgi:DNA polymerase I-like protein with 3'-5' exonuclease and polymerase domains
VHILTIDFETFYSRTYSLSKMTTEEYVRGDEFQVVGVSVQVDDAEPEWFSGSDEETLQFLQKFEFEKNLALAHNAMFDAAILTWHYGIKPKGWLDTLSMGRAKHGTEVGGSLKALAEHYELGVKGTEVENALGFRREDFSSDHLARYGEYCRNDVALTYKLFAAMSDQFPREELKLIDLTIKMYSEPVLQLDKRVLSSHLRKVKTKKTNLLGTFDKDQLMSNPQFADILASYGVSPPMKISPTTGRETYAFSKTDEGFKALLEHPDELIQSLAAARIGIKSTIEETRTERFLSIADRGALPVPLRYYAAHTGRWGGDDKLNLQNLPRTSDLKRAIIPPNGYVMLDSDSSQIEARTVAWLAGQDDLVAAFEAGEDVYKIMASAIYGKPVADVTKDERFVGKTTILGAGYGMGPVRFRDQLKTFGVTISEDESRHIIRTYRETYPKIPEFWKTAGKALEAVMDDQSIRVRSGRVC